MRKLQAVQLDKKTNRYMHGEEILVAHALGKIDGYKYTNCLEAFKKNYAKGHRLFEVDLYLTQDQKVVCAHGWENRAAKSQNPEWTELSPPTEKEFKASAIYGKYTPLSFADLVGLMKDYPDIMIITDTKHTDAECIKKQFTYMADTAASSGGSDILQRIVVQIYNEEMYDIVNHIYAFDSYIFTLYQRWNGDIEDFQNICSWCVDRGICIITVSLRLASQTILRIAKLYGIDVYVHTENRVLEARKLFRDGIKGIYTDELTAYNLKYSIAYQERKEERKKNNEKEKQYHAVTKMMVLQKRKAFSGRYIKKQVKKLVIFGAGGYGHRIYDIMAKHKIDIALFCDNNKSGTVDVKTGIEITGIEALKKDIEQYSVLLCVLDDDAQKDIKKQLLDAGFLRNQIYDMRGIDDSLETWEFVRHSFKFDFRFGIAGFIILGVTIFSLLCWNCGRVLFVVELFLMSLFNNSVEWERKMFGKMKFQTILYNIYSPLKGVGKGIKRKYLCCLFKTVAKTTVMAVVCFLMKTKVLVVEYIIIFMVVELLFAHRQAYRIGIPEFLENASAKTQLYEEKYINPDSVKITFPSQKRNLIYIYMESMEVANASMDVEKIGRADNLIPHLTALAQENISFSNTQDFGGMCQTARTGFTMAGILASTAGIPYMIPINGNSAGEHKTFLPNLTSLGDILERNGYRNYFMCGSEAGFAGRDLYFKTHGNYKIWDFGSAKEERIIAKANNFWGMQDSDLYRYAKKKLTEISRQPEPFNFTMLTVDTHHPDGYSCEKCPHIYSQKFANVIVCADNQLHEFLSWIREQEWYQNTVIVITGDHLSMAKDFYLSYSDERTIYNCFINTKFDKTVVREKARNFWTADLFPTVLAAMEADIEGNRLGLGVNLFSDRNSLLEEMGVETLNGELWKYSNYCVKNFA